MWRRPHRCITRRLRRCITRRGRWSCIRPPDTGCTGSTLASSTIGVNATDRRLTASPPGRTPKSNGGSGKSFLRRPLRHNPAGRLTMKITHATTRVLRMPADNPLVVGLPAPTDTREFVTLELGTDQGLVGVGLTFFGGALTPALKAAVDALAQLVMGDDPTQVEAIAGKAGRAAGSSGPGGIFALALSAVDMACWDIKGKAVGQSVCALLGGLRDRVPTYASGALMRPHPVKYLADAGPRLV